MGSKRKTTKYKKKQRSEIDYIESDENFAFIAGYTSNGFAYGVTWEEWEKLEEEDEKQSDSRSVDIEDIDLPF